MNTKPTYGEFVRKLAKSGELITNQLTPEMAHLWHMATGVAGEAGEVLDAVKKSAIYSKPLDVENLIEELGDLEFYMEGIRQTIGVTREEVLKANFEKLSKRFPNLEYSNEAAQKRADKQG
ncbi:putative nucleotide [Aeromonas phage PZL-Ah152]|uniref:Nucleotide n=2 Tax=Armandvirus TaxID=3424952 RepID=A0AAE8XBE0_9CAUD|nr:putative nucleotide [Aeromonas phage PZL-Ah152]UAT28109.1 putative nucleotide [Aeromonas phage PZL-Ah8]